MFSLNWSLTEDIMLYASASHGYKAGGINLDRDATLGPCVSAIGVITAGCTQAQIDAAATFRPEFSDSYEIGLRTQWFDRALTVNLTGFLTDYEDFQLNTFNGLGFIITNAGSVRAYGAELETRWNVNDNLAATFNAAWVEAQYGDEAGLGALSGRTLTNAPEWSVTGGVHYEHPIGDSGVHGFFDLNAAFRSQYNTGSNLAATKIQPEFTTIGGRIGLFGTDSQGGWDVYLWGENLTDEEIHVISFDSVFQSGSISSFLGAPQMYGATLRRRFN